MTRHNPPAEWTLRGRAAIKEKTAERYELEAARFRAEGEALLAEWREYQAKQSKKSKRNGRPKSAARAS